MQLTFQRPGATKIRDIPFGLAAMAALAAATAARADPYVSAWSTAQKSSVRLIAALDSPPQDFYRAGAEIRLDPGALTYWRSPGEAGAPPVFSFEGSENVADVKVLYPAPTRIEEAGTEVFGYLGEVAFPFHVTPKDSARPAILAMTLRYAVCERLCLPARAEASLALPPLRGAADDAAARHDALASEALAAPEARAEAAALAAAEAKAPARLSDAARDAKVAIKHIPGAAAPSWRLAALSGAAQDLFAEAPNGWYFETKKSNRPNEFLIVEIERPKAEAAAASVPVVLTLTEPQRSYEFSVELDRRAEAP